MKEPDATANPETGLTPQQERFCELLALGDMSKGEAWMQSGHATTTPESARVSASKFLKANAKARAYIQALREPIRYETVLAIQEKREKLAEIVRNDTKHETSDQLKAIDLDNKMAGHYAPDKMEVQGMDDLLELMSEIRSQ